MQQLITELADGTFRIPALVDAHVHIESSHLVPSRFGELIAAQGTLTAICDPHEIVNVLGERGLDFMLDSSHLSPARLLFTLPSCVPATPFETSGATLSAGLHRVRKAAREIDCTLTNPFATLSFLALPVIPALKLTDKGLIAC